MEPCLVSKWRCCGGVWSQGYLRANTRQRLSISRKTLVVAPVPAWLQKLWSEGPAMEDNFRVRVNKAFGSLASSSAPLSSLWSLTDDEIQRNEWNRDKEASELEKSPRPGPFPSISFPDGLSKEKKSMGARALLKEDLDDLECDGDDGREEEDRRWCASSSRSRNEEEWEIKSSVGLDSTLDFEEEEDEYDKVAVGNEKRGDRLYMKDVSNDYKTEADDWNELPTSFKDLARDPRANHIAAKLRLREDAEAAKKMDGLRVSEDKDSHSLSQNKESECEAVEEASVGSSEDCSLRSILKRKHNQADSKSQKRVRFSSESCGRDDDSNGEGGRENNDSAMETTSSAGGEDVSNLEYKLPSDYPSGIPDYMRNPSKYMHYTLDSGEMDEESNRQAYMDFLKMLKSRENSKYSLHEDVDVPIELPKAVAFVRKGKPSNTSTVENESGATLGQNSRSSMVSEGKRGVAVTPGIAAIVTTDEDEACPMEEDESKAKTDDGNTVKRGLQRPGRQYRTKPKDDPVD